MLLTLSLKLGTDLLTCKFRFKHLTGPLRSLLQLVNLLYDSLQVLLYILNVSDTHFE